MKNYEVKIYFKDKLQLAFGLDRVFVNTVFFENCTYRFSKSGSDSCPFDVITFLRNGKVLAMFFPDDRTDYEIVEHAEI